MSEHNPTKLKHEVEQHFAALAEIAGGLATYFCALVDEGFTRQEAQQLVRDYQQHFLSGIRREPQEP